MTHDQSNIIRRCIAALWEIESRDTGPNVGGRELVMAWKARRALENLWDNYRPEPKHEAQTKKE